MDQQRIMDDKEIFIRELQTSLEAQCKVEIDSKNFRLCVIFDRKYFNSQADYYEKNYSDELELIADPDTRILDYYFGDFTHIANY